MPHDPTRATGRASRLRAAIAPAVAAALLAAACGAEEEPESIAVEPGTAMDTTPAGTPAPPPPGVSMADRARQVNVRLAEWAIELSRDTVPQGELTFRIANTGTRPHALEVEGNGVESATQPIAPGQTGSLTVRLEPGTYQVYCPVDDQVNHEQQGMRTTLVVRADGAERARP